MLFPLVILLHFWLWLLAPEIALGGGDLRACAAVDHPSTCVSVNSKFGEEQMSKHIPRVGCFRYALAAVAACLLMSFNALAAPPDEKYSARTQVTLPNSDKVTSFDISFVDPVIGLYLLADRTNKSVDVVDIFSNTPLFQLTSSFGGAEASNDNAGPDGVITVNHREVWAGDGPSQIKVIDLFTQQTTHVIGTGGANRADELCFDPRDQLVVMANDA